MEVNKFVVYKMYFLPIVAEWWDKLSHVDRFAELRKLRGFVRKTKGEFGLKSDEELKNLSELPASSLPEYLVFALVQTKPGKVEEF